MLATRQSTSFRLVAVLLLSVAWVTDTNRASAGLIYTYTFEFDEAATIINDEEFTFAADEFSFTTSDLIDFLGETADFSPAADLNGFVFDSVWMNARPIDFSSYNLSANEPLDFEQPNGTVVGFEFVVPTSPGVGVFETDTARRRVVFDTGFEIGSVDAPGRLTITAVPEPSTLALLGCASALLGLGRLRRNRRQNSPKHQASA